MQVVLTRNVVNDRGNLGEHNKIDAIISKHGEYKCFTSDIIDYGVEIFSRLKRLDQEKRCKPERKRKK